ncbi:MAG TPA: class I SAM-dependent methyltransferase [Aggregatilineaceae bacterium]|nr:class I SAM-dependent methyltransferase [Aggregatilineaceae bacterium]
MIPWFVGVLVIAVILYLLDREIYFYEAVHLSPRIQHWLYDRWAAKYDQGKKETQQNDQEMLALPMISRLGPNQPALMLDLATGTARLPVILLREPNFSGTIIALDISRAMLVQASAKLTPFRDRVTLIQYTDLPLPFPDNSFDVVSCLEALELMPNMQAPLAELARVLRPGGLLLTSHGNEALGWGDKVVNSEKFTELLLTSGFEQIEILPWWKKFDLVWACKTGQSAPASIRPWSELVQHHTGISKTSEGIIILDS